MLLLYCGSGLKLLNSLQLNSTEQPKYWKGFQIKLQSQVCCIQLLMFALTVVAQSGWHNIWHGMPSVRNCVCVFCSPQGVKVLNQLAGLAKIVSTDGPEQMHRYTHAKTHTHRSVHMHRMVCFVCFWCFIPWFWKDLLCPFDNILLFALLVLHGDPIFLGSVTLLYYNL